ncbi:hypothetical protein D3C73_1240470 [compost metagenome]
MFTKPINPPVLPISPFILEFVTLQLLIFVPVLSPIKIPKLPMPVKFILSTFVFCIEPFVTLSNIPPGGSIFSPSIIEIYSVSDIVAFIEIFFIVYLLPSKVPEKDLIGFKSEILLKSISFITTYVEVGNIL